MRYTKGWEYRIEDPFAYRLAFDYKLQRDFITPWFTITRTNWLLVMPGYASDGATWFPDFPWIRTAAVAVHDPLCNAIELGGLPESMNEQIDRELACAIQGNPATTAFTRQLLRLRGAYVRRATGLVDSVHGQGKRVYEMPRLAREA